MSGGVTASSRLLYSGSSPGATPSASACRPSSCAAQSGTSLQLVASRPFSWASEARCRPLTLLRSIFQACVEDRLSSTAPPLLTHGRLACIQSPSQRSRHAAAVRKHAPSPVARARSAAAGHRQAWLPQGAAPARPAAAAGRPCPRRTARPRRRRRPRPRASSSAGAGCSRCAAACPASRRPPRQSWRPPRPPRPAARAPASSLLPSRPSTAHASRACCACAAQPAPQRRGSRAPQADS